MAAPCAARKGLFVRTLPLAWREVVDPSDAALPRVRKLYECTLDLAERIPWEWIVSGVGRKPTRSDEWWPHLLIAEDGDGLPVGFFSGLYLPGYGGYACYLGVDPAARRRGVGRLLYQRLFSTFCRDASRLVEPLRFVIWESHRPDADADDAAQSNWQARLRLFAKVGAFWIDEVDFRVPNYMDRLAPPVKLELFLTPFDRPVERFDPPTLRKVIIGLHGRVYGQGPGDELYERAQDAAREPRLRPVADCG
jgi:GNAT superfamily N-acetyltransferase